MPDSNLPSGGGPYLPAHFAVVYSKGSIVAHGGRHSGFTPEHAFRFNSQMCPPPSRTEICPQSARRRNPERPSITFSTRRTAAVEEPDFFIGSRELRGAPLRQEQLALVLETCQYGRLEKHCGQRRRRPLLPRQLHGQRQGLACLRHGGFPPAQVLAGDTLLLPRALT